MRDAREQRRLALPTDKEPKNSLRKACSDSLFPFLPSQATMIAMNPFTCHHVPDPTIILSFNDSIFWMPRDA